MDFEIPAPLAAYLRELDEFIEAKIKPLEQRDDNIRFFDHRREYARTDFEAGGTPRPEWEELLAEARHLADAAGHYRYPFPVEHGGRGGGILDMAVIRDHLAQKGLGLHNDLQNEHSIVGNNVGLMILLKYGSDAQKAEFLEEVANGNQRFAFAITEPDHGSDATYMETTAERLGDRWVINGQKMWNSDVHGANYDMIFARSSGNPGDARGITAFLVPTKAPGFKVEEWLWTFNMPTDHAKISLTNVEVPESAILGEEGRGLDIIQNFFNENRIRQAASSLGAATYCVREAVEYAKVRKPFGKALATNQGVQFPLVDLHTQCELVRALVYKTAWRMDRYGAMSESDKVSMCNYTANRLVCDAADQAMQTHGGIGYSRHKPFEHIYRHHRRYRITEGADEIQQRRVAGYLFGFMEKGVVKGVERR
jgi:acyl-CoA dehydrogenase